MSENITICPDCGSDFETTASIDGANGVLQSMHQECPDCGYETDIAIVNYPNRRYEVIGDSLDGDTCTVTVDSDQVGVREECGRPANIRMQFAGQSEIGPMEFRCSDHTGAHRYAAIDMEDDS